MIFAKATLYVVNEEKLKGFIDYLYVLTKKTRMLSNNLSFEYGFVNKNVVLIERWTSQKDYLSHIKTDEFSKELSTLEKMSKHINILYITQTLS